MVKRSNFSLVPTAGAGLEIIPQNIMPRLPPGCRL